MSLNLIPQVFYDLIARVVPGSTAVIMWYMTILGPKKAFNTLVSVMMAPNQSVANLWSLVLLIMLAYVLGFVLDELWDFTFRRIRRRIAGGRKSIDLRTNMAQYNKVRKWFGGSELEFGHKDLPAVHTMHDHLRLRSPSEAHRLLKLRAERTMCEAIFIGVFFLPLANIWFWYNDGNLIMPDRIALELVVIVALLTLWTASDKLDRFYVGGTVTAWLLLNFPVGPDKQQEMMKDRPE